MMTAVSGGTTTIPAWILPSKGQRLNRLKFVLKIPKWAMYFTLMIFVMRKRSQVKQTESKQLIGLSEE